MSPIPPSDQQPDNPDKPPPIQAGAKGIVIPHELRTSVGEETLLLIREADWKRHIKTAGNLEGKSSLWSNAAGVMAGIAGSFVVAAVVESAHAVTLALLSFLFVILAAGCLLADRQVNEQREGGGKKLATEMEETAPVQRIIMGPVGEPRTRDQEPEPPT